LSVAVNFGKVGGELTFFFVTTTQKSKKRTNKIQAPDWTRRIAFLPLLNFLLQKRNSRDLIGCGRNAHVTPRASFLANRFDWLPVFVSRVAGTMLPETVTELTPTHMFFLFWFLRVVNKTNALV